ncbi:MAG: SDR family NAD(P)-dependent oxidoreductase [Cyanobacteria bacterium CRU_2_1]|nr:SDR family NAD(P)-dependent oxidoreductase [Cyanobacteria bacterium CRU_2_1]
MVLQFPELIDELTDRLPLSIGINSVVLAEMSEEQLQQQLEAIGSHYDSIGAFIHLHPAHHLGFEFETSLLKFVFLMAKHLKRSLNQVTNQERNLFCTVTRLDGELGLGQKGDFSAVAGGLFGLTKTLNLEWERVFCRAIDLNPDLDAASATQAIIAELHDPDRSIVEVGYSLQGRTTVVSEASILTGHIPKNIDPSSVFLVSGGGKGITAQCAIQLAQVAKCKFILLGRSAIVPKLSSAEDCVDEAELKQRILADLATKGERLTPATIQKMLNGILSECEITQTIRAIEQAGGHAEYISTDITDTSTLPQQVIDAVERFGAITGIIHGAGVLADKLIEHKTEQDFESVYAAKINGLKTLLNYVNPHQLKHLILFSSVAGFYGNIGQADYAISNEILNKFAYQFQRHYPACQVISFNWGPWDGGMVTPELKQLFAQRQIETIPIDVGTQMFVDELTGGETVQVLIGGSLASSTAEIDSQPDLSLQTYRIRRHLTLDANPFLLDHTIGDRVVLPMTCSVVWMANACEQLYPGYTFFSCQNYQVLKGIIFDHTLASEYILDLVEIEKSNSSEIQFAATIWSEPQPGKHRYHYTAQIELRQQIPFAPLYAAFNPVADETLTRSPYDDGTLFHGPSFRGVKRILNITPERLTAECVLPAIDERQQGQFPTQSLNAIALDVAHQSLLIWVRYFYQAASLPLQFQRGEHFRAVPIGETFYLSLAVNSSSETKLIADLTVHDRHGNVYSQVFGAEVTISKQLNRLFFTEK